jgi:hypothetical protein
VFVKLSRLNYIRIMEPAKGRVLSLGEDVYYAGAALIDGDYSICWTYRYNDGSWKELPGTAGVHTLPANGEIYTMDLKIEVTIAGRTYTKAEAYEVKPAGSDAE